jgi:broad specificity phosphatase PhoE
MNAPVTRLTLLRHGPTTATRRASFPRDEALEVSAQRLAQGLGPRLGRHDAVWSGPAQCALETAAALGLTAIPCDDLDDANPGAWRGLTIEEIERSDPDGLAAWMRDPAVPPPGGESTLDVLDRVRCWMAERSAEGRNILAITHSIVIRAAVVHALMAPPESVWRVDVAPLSRTVLHSYGDRWTLRAANLT